MRLYNHTLPNDCKTRLSLLGPDFKDQPLNTGNAALANVDYYAVEITTRPDINNDGNPDSDEEIFNYYKNNFAGWATGGKEDFQFSCDIPADEDDRADVSWRFEPYTQQDVTLWASNNPLTSIFKIYANADIPFGAMVSDAGAIMISEFTSDSWTGSTIQTLYSGSQPFSGNRQWGYLHNENGNLELYARAVDIAHVADYFDWDPFGDDDCREETYYNIGDATWSNLQDQMKTFLEVRGAEVEVVEKTAIRFDKDKLKEMLESNLAIDQIPCSLISKQ